MVGVITDYLYISASGYFKRKNDTLKLMLTNWYFTPADSNVVCDTSKRPVLTMNRHIYMDAYHVVFWAVYNKDSANVSSLWGRRMVMTINSIRRITGEMPGSYLLEQNYPNPFNSVTVIRFNIGNSRSSDTKNEFVTLRVYDIQGRAVKTLFEGNLSEGVYEVRFDGSNLPSGVYYYKLIADSYSETKRMVLLK